MPFTLILEQIWRWLADTGINLALLIVLALLVPRAGRLANRYVERQVADSKDPDEGKSSLAIAGVMIYIGQLLAYFLILVFFLQQVGFSLAGAAIPATVVSAAVGFGAQSIISDFFSGFFILTEKQYGVGDLVTFQINGTEVTGDVIQITMRATQIRTLEQNTVTIPNSTAQVCINNSNVWSRALVVVPVPLARSRDVNEVIARAERAARKALANPEIAPLIQGELMSQPGIEINPPNTVGMPWTLDIRFMVRCAPGDQFPVERALRVHILEEFFDEYGAETATPLLDDAATEAFPAVSPHRYRTGWSDLHDPSRPEQADEGDSEGTPPSESVAATEPANDTDATDTEVLAVDGLEGTQDEVEEVPAEDDPAANPKEDHAIATFGGRIRASTGLLITLFLGLLILRGLTMTAGESSEARSGVLAPPRSTTSVTESSPAENTGSATDESNGSAVEPTETYETEVPPANDPSVEQQAPGQNQQQSTKPDSTPTGNSSAANTSVEPAPQGATGNQQPASMTP